MKSFLDYVFSGPKLTNQQCQLKMSNFMFCCVWGGECAVCLKDNFPAGAASALIIDFMTHT